MFFTHTHTLTHTPLHQDLHHTSVLLFLLPTPSIFLPQGHIQNLSESTDGIVLCKKDFPLQSPPLVLHITFWRRDFASAAIKMHLNFKTHST